jgi:hypothetical protein
MEAFEVAERQRYLLFEAQKETFTVGGRRGRGRCNISLLRVPF